MSTDIILVCYCLVFQLLQTLLNNHKFRKKVHECAGVIVGYKSAKKGAIWYLKVLNYYSVYIQTHNGTLKGLTMKVTSPVT